MRGAVAEPHRRLFGILVVVRVAFNSVLHSNIVDDRHRNSVQGTLGRARRALD